MDVMLQHHGAKMVYPVPEGLRELCMDISREVLRAQPSNIYGFISQYVNALLISREHARVATRILGEILDESVSYEAAWKRRGVTLDDVLHSAIVIQSAYRGYCTRKLYKEHRAIYELLKYYGVDPATGNKACIIIQTAYRGHLARNYVKTHTVPEDVAMSPESREQLNKFMISMNLSWTDANAAATRIQTAFRRKLGESKEEIEVKKSESIRLTHEEITELAQVVVTTLISEITEPKESEVVVDSVISMLVSKAEEIIEVTPMPEPASKTESIAVVKAILSSLVLKTLEDAAALKAEQGEEYMEEEEKEEEVEEKEQESLAESETHQEDKVTIKSEFEVPFSPSIEEIRNVTISEESGSAIKE